MSATKIMAELVDSALEKMGGEFAQYSGDSKTIGGHVFAVLVCPVDVGRKTIFRRTWYMNDKRVSANKFEREVSKALEESEK